MMVVVAVMKMRMMMTDEDDSLLEDGWILWLRCAAGVSGGSHEASPQDLRPPGVAAAGWTHVHTCTRTHTVTLLVC